MCKAMRCRPSELMGFDEYPMAFYFDRAVFYFGTHVENEMEKAGSGKGKSETQRQMARNMVMQRYLGVGQFR